MHHFVPTPPPAYFHTAIDSLEGAHAFLEALRDDGLLFHPEDSPDTIVDHFGLRLFTDEEAALAKQRISEVYRFDQDPCAYCLALARPSDPQSNPG